MEPSPYEPLEHLARGARLRGAEGPRASAHAWFSNVLHRMTFLAVAEYRGLLAEEHGLQALLRVETGAYAAFEQTSRVLFAARGGALFAEASASAGAEVEDAAFVRAGLSLVALASRGIGALGAVHECLLEHHAEFCAEPMVVVPRKRRPGEPTTDEILPLREAEARSATRVKSGRGASRHLPIGALALSRSLGRRTAGSHYTSTAVAAEVVRAALEPLTRTKKNSPRSNAAPDADLLALTVCDPAMGSGAFVIAALDWFAARGCDRTAVAKRCLFGVDRDAMAVTLARHAMWIAAEAKDEPFTFVDHALVVGDALAAPPRGIDWSRTFAHVDGRGGFSALVGNPPWVSYAGRAAQPLEGELREWYTHRFRSFAGYRNLQGLFVERAVELLGAGGRLGFVLPSSMSELGGYAPVRAVHDSYSVCDVSLPDLGDGGFEGVFQPSMVLLSTKRGSKLEHGRGDPWPLARADLDDVTRGILRKLDREPLPAATFGERGLQSLTSDGDHFRVAADARFSVPLRVGGDIEPFLRRPPRTFADPAHFGTRLRSAAEWSKVAVVIRQTARYPMAVRSDGAAFRNSLLACFDSEPYPADFLVAYLNSAPIRFAHYMRHRDARNGMPQMKIGHLRSIPAPPNVALVSVLNTLGNAWSARNEGLRSEEQRELDAHVAAAFDLDAAERARIESWAAQFSAAG